jgi:hypothetical protein
MAVAGKKLAHAEPDARSATGDDDHALAGHAAHRACGALGTKPGAGASFRLRFASPRMMKLGS